MLTDAELDALVGSLRIWAERGEWPGRSEHLIALANEFDRAITELREQNAALERVAEAAKEPCGCRSYWLKVGYWLKVEHRKACPVRTALDAAQETGR